MHNKPRVILFLNADRGFYRGLLSGISRYSALNGPWTFFRRPPGYLQTSRTFNIEELREWNPDGIICSITHDKSLLKLNIPTIVYDPGNYTGAVPCIVSDDNESGKLAAQHLLDMSHRNFAFCGYGNMPWSSQRCRSFDSVISKAGFKVHIYDSSSIHQPKWAEGKAKLQRWLKSLPKPIGIFCANDDLASVIMDACRILGFGMPEDFSIIGADDDEYICELQNPPLSSIGFASEQAGFKAADLLHRMMRRKAGMEGQRIVADAIGITARQSTDILMTENVAVRKALHFIHANINQNIQVKDVVKTTSLAHRTLNEQFNAELGCSIGKQITRARVDYISRLLSQTKMRVQEIAYAVGYEDDCHFSRYFKRATGMTPQAYRRKVSIP